MLFRERIRANRHLEMRKALFLTKLRKHPTPHKDVTSMHTNPAGWPRGTEQNPTKTSCCFSRRRNDTTHKPKAGRRLGHPEQARNRTAVAPNTTTSPRASKFCFLKLPIVFGYVVPFAAISKKQNRKGSPQSLIYPLKSKLTSFVIKQFFTPKRYIRLL